MWKLLYKTYVYFINTDIHKFDSESWGKDMGLKDTVKKVSNNVITLGASSRVEKATNNYRVLTDQLEDLNTEYEVKRANINHITLGLPRVSSLKTENQIINCNKSKFNSNLKS